MFLGTITIKKSHKNLQSHWVKKKLGKQVYDQLLRDGNALELVSKPSKVLPDIYMDVDIFARFASEKNKMWFSLTW